MKVAHSISEKLKNNLNIQSLEIIDESEKHRGHAGFQEGGESHFIIKIISNDFEGLNKVKRHKLIYQILDFEIKNKIHALSIDAKTEDEIEKN